MANLPPKLSETIEDFSFMTTRQERQQYLIQLADEFKEVKVPAHIAEQPYDEGHRVPACESDAFVWWEAREDGTLQYYFDVLNPQGLSAMAIAVILGRACSGASLDEIDAISEDVVFEFFGKNISMGKGQGLMGIINMVKAGAKQQSG
ncbi:MAG: SufE family protein [Anaerolineae bacterium]